MVELLLEAVQGVDKLWESGAFRHDLQDLIDRNMLWGPPSEGFDSYEVMGIVKAADHEWDGEKHTYLYPKDWHGTYQVDIVDPEQGDTKDDEPHCAHGVGFKITAADSRFPRLWLQRYRQGVLDGRSKMLTAQKGLIGSLRGDNTEWYWLAGRPCLDDLAVRDSPLAGRGPLISNVAPTAAECAALGYKNHVGVTKKPPHDFTDYALTPDSNCSGKPASLSPIEARREGTTYEPTRV